MKISAFYFLLLILRDVVYYGVQLGKFVHSDTNGYQLLYCQITEKEPISTKGVIT